jgi:general secretion pathway protein G
MQNGNVMPRARLGFTLVELLVVLSILALLLSLAYPKYFSSVERAQETALKQTLMNVRDGIDKFYADTGKYPETLEQLVEKKYINQLPLDPITDSTETWLIEQPEPPLEGMVYDVHSGAPGKAKDGSLYSEW